MSIHVTQISLETAEQTLTPEFLVQLKVVGVFGTSTRSVQLKVDFFGNEQLKVGMFGIVRFLVQLKVGVFRINLPRVGKLG